MGILNNMELLHYISFTSVYRRRYSDSMASPKLMTERCLRHRHQQIIQEMEEDAGAQRGIRRERGERAGIRAGTALGLR